MPVIGGIDAGHLESFIQRIERLESEKKNLAEDIKEVWAEAKGAGFDVKIMKECIKLRAMDKADLSEKELLLETYKRALGMLDGTPLGDYALENAA